MKANVAPEKIYIQSFNVSEEHVKFDKSKLFFDDVWTEEPEKGLENIEYTRTDAFIEKACSWLENNLQGIVGGSIYIEDFREYLKK